MRTFYGFQLRQYDEWLGADRLRSKAIVPKSEGSKAAFGAVMPQAAKKILLVKPKVTWQMWQMWQMWISWG